ncbi:MAG: hypothetical protein ACI4ON_01040 [Clostridia bacterium]
MPREKGSSQGTVYFRPDRKRWIAQYYDYDPITLKSSKKTKCFKDEDSAKKIYKKFNVSKRKSYIYRKSWNTIKRINEYYCTK